MNFKDPNGRFFTKSLFWEYSYDTGYQYTQYTLKREPHQGYPSFYQKYLELLDPTEYKVATTLLGGWDHWEQLLKASWFNSEVLQWRRELAAKIESMAMDRLITLASSPSDKNAFAAAKYLHERAEKAAGKRDPGRPRGSGPNQRATHQRASQDVLEASRIETDFNRIKELN